jgi:hypothetical protein
MVDTAYLTRVVQKAAAQALVLEPTAQKLSKSGTTKFATALSSADIALQQAIIRRLRHRYPDIPIVGEEDTPFSQVRPEHDQAEYFVVDPIDGSHFFLERSKNYAVQLAFVSNNEYVASAASLPAYRVSLASPPWHITSHIEQLKDRTAFCAPETLPAALDQLRTWGYSPILACGLQCLVAPLLWPDSIGLYPRELSIRGKIGLALALQGGALVLTHERRPVTSVTVAGHVGSVLVLNRAATSAADLNIEAILNN